MVPQQYRNLLGNPQLPPSVTSGATNCLHHCPSCYQLTPCPHQQLFTFSCACFDSGAPAKAKAPRKRAPKKAVPPDGDAQGSMSDTSCEQITVAGSDSVKKVPKSRKKFKNELTIRLIAAAKAALAAPETGVQPHAIAGI